MIQDTYQYTITIKSGQNILDTLIEIGNNLNVKHKFSDKIFSDYIFEVFEDISEIFEHNLKTFNIPFKKKVI